MGSGASGVHSFFIKCLFRKYLLFVSVSPRSSSRCDAPPSLFFTPESSLDVRVGQPFSFENIFFFCPKPDRLISRTKGKRPGAPR